jgi:sialate O-acetylesterase
MKIEQGLFDHIVIQRNKRNVSEAVFAGMTSSTGVVTATVKKGGKVLGSFRAARVGTAGHGQFRGCLEGLQAGGPYDVTLEIRKNGIVVETAKAKDILVGDVWIVAGQSNAQGCGFVKHGPRAHSMTRAFYMDDKWRPARDPIHNMWKTVDQVHIDLCGGVRPGKSLIIGTGPGVAFGQRMYELTGRIPQGLLACAHGGTSMAQWDPKLKIMGSKSLYGAMLRRFRKNGGKVAGVVWYQGCSDADPNVAPLYTERMRTLVASMRRDFHNSDLPFALVQIGRVVGWGASAPWNSIQDQQRRLPGVIRNCVTVPAIDLSLEDAIHISGRGQSELGQRLADAVRSLMTKGKSGKAPIALKKVHIRREAERGMVNLAVEFDNVVGKLVAKGRPYGFSVVNQNGAENAFDILLSGNQAIVRTGLMMDAVPSMNLHYGYGTNPYCNIVDEAGRPIPVLGPIPLSAPRALTGYVTTLRLSRFLPSAGKLDKLAYPRSKATLKLRTRTFQTDFCNLHPELEKLAPEDVTVFYACNIECYEPMKLAVSLGYDGPVKVWVDGKLKFHDPDGINPAVAGEEKIKFSASRGQHEVLVALGSNFGKAWGVFLAFERFDVPKALIQKGPGNYLLPKILG